MKRLVNILIRAVVEPTAASAPLPLNRPTTMISTALNISCRMLESMSGMEKEISLSMIDPLHMSISYLFRFTAQFLLSFFANDYLTAFSLPRQCVSHCFRADFPL